MRKENLNLKKEIRELEGIGEERKKDYEGMNKDYQQAEKDLKATKGELQNAQDSIKEYQRSLANVRKQARSLEEDLVDADKKVVDAEDRAIVAEKKAADAADKAIVAEKKAAEAVADQEIEDELAAELSAALTSEHNLKEEVKVLKKSLAAAEARTLPAAAQVATVGIQTDALISACPVTQKNEVNEIATQTDGVVEELSSTKEQELVEKVATLEAANDNLKNNAHAVASDKVSAEKAFAVLKADRDTLSSQVRSLEERSATAQDSNASLKVELQEAHKKLASFQENKKELDEAKRELHSSKSIKSELEETKKKVHALENVGTELEATKQKIATLEAVSKELAETKQKLTDLENIKNEAEKAIWERRGAEDKAQSLLRERDAKAAEVQICQSKIHQIQHELTEYEHGIKIAPAVQAHADSFKSQYDTEVQTLASEKADAENRLEQLRIAGRSELSRLEVKNKELQSRNVGLGRSNDELVKEAASERRQRLEKDAEFRSLQLTTEIGSADLAKLQEERKKYCDHEQTKENEICRLQEMVNQLKAQLADNESLFGSSTPDSPSSDHADQTMSDYTTQAPADQTMADPTTPAPVTMGDTPQKGTQQYDTTLQVLQRQIQGQAERVGQLIEQTEEYEETNRDPGMGEVQAGETAVASPRMGAEVSRHGCRQGERQGGDQATQRACGELGPRDTTS